MKVVCELCKKRWKINEKKMTARGTTVYCPRCKHAHLVKRVVNPYPVDPEFRTQNPNSGGERTVETVNPSGATTISPAGMLLLHREEAPPTGSITPKPKYNWKKFLQRKNKPTKPQSFFTKGKAQKSFMGRLIAAFAKVIFLIFIVAVLAGYLYYRQLPPSDQMVIYNNLQALFDLGLRQLRQFMNPN